MRVLYFINAGIMGGRERHVHTLVRSLPPTIEALVCAVSGGEATEAMKHDGLNVHVLGGRNGHDLKILPRFIRLINEFKPDVIHAHSAAFLPYLALRFFSGIPLVESIHGPTSKDTGELKQPPRHKRIIAQLVNRALREPDYYLPVSEATWQGFLRSHPHAQGEVFFNALNLTSLSRSIRKTENGPQKKIIGMVARMADQKDWPSFVRISTTVMQKDPAVEAWAIGDGPVRGTCEVLWLDLARQHQLDPGRLKWFGSRQDARELMAKMNVFLLTSKHEQLPTTMLEAFALKTPVIGFLPDGGTTDILKFERKPCAILRDDRDTDVAAADVLRVLGDSTLRDNLVTEGYRIVHEHFDMQKLCATQLINIYRKIIKANAK